MNCKSCKKLMNQAAAHALDNDLWGQMEQHLASCQSCRGEWGVTKLLDSVAYGARVPEVPPFLAARVMAAVSGEEQVGRRTPVSGWGMLPWGARLAAVLGAVVLVVGATALGASLASRSATRLLAVPTNMAQGDSTTNAQPSDWTGFFQAESEDLPLGWYLAGDPASDMSKKPVRSERPKEMQQ